jgi:hypothetical protein
VESLASGLTLVLLPFRDEGENILLKVRGGVGRVEARGIATIPGVHWSWPAALPKSMSVRRLDAKSWKIRSFAEGDEIGSEGFDLKYRGTFAYSSWPVVNGNRGDDGGTITLGSVLKGWPVSGDSPIRLYFYNGKSPLPLRGGRTCGEGCVDFSGFVEAMETPVSYSKSSEGAVTLGSLEQFPWHLSFPGGSYIDSDDASAVASEVRERVFTAWQTLTSRWGTLPVGDAFAVHLLVESGCSYQGLEHAAGTLLDVGYCAGTNFRNRLLKLAVHEIIHTWNGRYLYPFETASWNALTFSEERLNQLYFYEGVTEGFARLLLSEQESALRAEIVERWNSSIVTLAQRGLGKSLRELSRTNYSLAYEAGAMLLLRLAAESRLEFGESVARERVWGIISALRADTEAGPFDVSKPLWNQRCFRDGLFALCNGGAVGYSEERLRVLLGTHLGLANWSTLVAAHFEASFAPNLTALNEIVGRVSMATGVQTTFDASGVRHFVVPLSGGSEGQWPL